MLRTRPTRVFPLALTLLTGALPLEAQTNPPPLPVPSEALAQDRYGIGATGPRPDYYELQANYSALNLDDVINVLDTTGGWNRDQTLDYLEEEGYGKPILRRQDLPEVLIRFNSLRPMPRRDIITALESLLALNGIAIIEFNPDYMMAVPAPQALASTTDYLAVDASGIKGTQKIFSKIYTLDYLSLDEATPIVQSFVGSGLPLVPFQRSNSFLVTDYLRNLQRIEQVLTEVDTPPQITEEVLFFGLNNTSASELSSRLENLAQDNNRLGRYLQGTSITADDRTNQLVVVTHPSNVALITDVIEKLDVDVAPLTRSEVYSIRHAQAPDVADIIQQIISGQQSARENLEAPEQGVGRTAPPTQPAVPGQAPQPSTPSAVADSAGEANLQFSEFVTIVADERSNAIVAYGTGSDLEQLKDLIEKIDVILAQVLIEVVIAEVTLTEDDARGIDAFDIQYNTVGFPGNEIGFNVDAVSTSRLGTPFDFSGSVRDFSISAVIGTAASKSNVKILSTPNIMVQHAEEAEIIVGESRPVITQSISDIDNPGNTSSSVSFRDIGIELTVEPLIGSDGSIQLEITQIVDTVVGTVTIDGNEQPIIGRREANSTLTVSDRETIVLAGLQEFNATETDSDLAFFRHIPLVGRAFGGKTRADTRRELVLFIKPYIVDTEARKKEIVERKLENTQARSEIEGYLDSGQFDPDPVIALPEKEWKHKSRRRF
ncbi:MAG: secretin N-terminal domain-containing protein [Opitutales bacterium]